MGRYLPLAPSPGGRGRSPYALLGRFLAPAKDEAAAAALGALARAGAVPWEHLLSLANRHVCTPLWYVRLRDDGLLAEVPAELAEYLAALHAANRQRNQALRAGLEEVLGRLAGRGIAAVLLKGAATFCDDLYGDLGARIMGDVDLLIEPARAREARDALVEVGYRFDPADEPDPVKFPLYTHHHLPPLFRPGGALVVELHLAVEGGPAGRALATADPWRSAAPARLGACETRVLDPTLRVLHNALHEFSSHPGFIASHAALGSLAEFAHLGRRYGAEIRWADYLALARRQGLGLAAATYLELASRELGLPFPAGVARPARARAHARRVAWVAAAAPAHPGPRPGLARRLARRALLGAARLYFWWGMPGYVWHKYCHAEGLGRLPERVWCLARMAGRGLGRAVRGAGAVDPAAPREGRP
ncbi:MAG: nucleotidyltransferase domain-containing protein [Deferrisomatales bacterium]